jgi:WD40 repeat protein
MAGNTGNNFPIGPPASPPEEPEIVQWSPCARRPSAKSELVDHKHVIKGVALDPDGRRLATSSSDETVGLWDLATRRKLGSYGKSPLGYASVSFSRDGKRIAAASGEGGPVKVWDIASGREVARFKYTERVVKVRFATDDRTLVISTASPLSLFRAPTFAEINAAETGAFKSQQLSMR